jgi:tRNA(adenine34) deaminase
LAEAVRSGASDRANGRKLLRVQGDSGLCYRNVLGNAQPAWSVDERFMWAALKLAAAAGDRREVPVGAVVVLGGVVIGEGFNQPIGTHDPTAHAEIVAIRDAARRTANYRLTGATMYVTIEPCQMCVGAMVHARVARVVYGAREPKAGAIESAMRAHEHPSLNHRLVAVGGVLDEECRSVIQGFFEERRRAE